MRVIAVCAVEYIPRGESVTEVFFDVPAGARALVVFAHGTGSSRHSRRNQYVAQRLREGGRFGTLLFDLLTAEEDRFYANRFEIGLLTRRLVEATMWVAEQPASAGLPVAYFGASTGAAAALAAAVELPDVVRAVVSRGGRPDLAGGALPLVRVPVLLIVGGADCEVLRLNEEARAQLTVPSELAVVPGATHLFEEPGALERVAELTLDFLGRQLVPAAGTRGMLRGLDTSLERDRNDRF